MKSVAQEQSEMREGISSSQIQSGGPAKGFERHFTVMQLAKEWGYSHQTIRRLFVDEPGVLRIGRPRSSRHRPYTSLRIPQSVAQRVYRRLQKDTLQIGGK